MILEMINNNLLISSSYNKWFFQYILLYQKLSQIVKDDYIKYVLFNYSYENLKIIIKDDYDSHNKKILILLKIFILFFFVNEEIQSCKEIEKVKSYLFSININISSILIEQLKENELLFRLIINILLDEKYLKIHNINNLQLNQNTIETIIKEIFFYFNKLFNELKYSAIIGLKFLLKIKSFFFIKKIKKLIHI
jgi:hypothetical protein